MDDIPGCHCDRSVLALQAQSALLIDCGHPSVSLASRFVDDDLGAERRTAGGIAVPDGRRVGRERPQMAGQQAQVCREQGFPGAGTTRERHGGGLGHRELLPGVVDVDPRSDDHPTSVEGDPLAEDARDLPVVVGRKLHVVGPLEHGLDPRNLPYGLGEREAGGQRDPAHRHTLRRDQRRHGETSTLDGDPVAAQSTASLDLSLGDDDPPGHWGLTKHRIGRPHLGQDLDRSPRRAGCDERDVQFGGLTMLRHGRKARLGSMASETQSIGGTDVPTDIDTSTTDGKLKDLKRRVAEVANAGSERAVEKQHARGKKTARERLELLLDEGSFVEMDKYARHRSTAFGQDRSRPYGDGVVTGYGTVDGRTVAVFAQDFTVFGGSLGEVFGEKICKVMDFAMKIGCPVIGLNDSGGARIQEGVVSLGLYGEIFRRNVHASGVIPQISLIMGPCAGGAVYSPAVTDFTVMVDQTSHMFITGPDVIKTVTGEDVAFEELGGARTHNTKSGVAHYMGSDEDDAIDYVKALLSYLPSNNLEDAPVFGGELDLDVTDTDRVLDTLIPDSPNVPYDMHTVIECVVDDGEFLEVQPLFAPNMVIGFARVEGRSIGIVANNPMQFAGTLDIDASEKAARFVRTCDAFNVPILTLVDVPGFLPGTDQEWDGIIRRGAKLIYAYAEATVPLVTVITRKAYGGAYDVMGSKHLGADINLAWPTAQIAVMGAQGAVNILYRKELAQAAEKGESVDEARAAFIKEYEDTLANPYIAAERGYIDTVITPSNTRMNVSKALRALRTKRETLPPKKHGNIPL